MNHLKKLLAISAMAATFAASASAETLRVGMECTYEPFNYRTSAGELAGYDVDVAKGVAEIIGADLEFVCQQWDGMIPGLLANKYDLIVASLSITESRQEKIDFSSPYRDSLGRLVGRSGQSLELFDAQNNPIADNFDGVKIGIERASTYENWFNATLPDADIALYDGNDEMYLDLMNGRVDAIMTNPMKAHLRFLGTDDGSAYEFVSPAISEVEFFGTGVGIGLRKGQPELKARLDDAIKQLIKEGKLTDYALQYFPFPIHNEEWADS